MLWFYARKRTTKQYLYHGKKNNNFVSLTLPSFIIKENHFQSVITIQEDSFAQHWIANGELHQHYNSLKATLYSSDSLKVSIPYITRRYGAKITFDTLSYSLTKEIGSSKQVYLKGKARVNGLDVFHKALSPESFISIADNSVTR